jgi:riboflavin kinase/FMN adenylyltransferase
MIRHFDIGQFSAKNPVVTVGIFDGIHLGHRFIIQKLKEAAERRKGESVLVTLWPHPRVILNQVDDSFRLLNTMKEKTGMLEDMGLDHLVVIEFTHEFSRLSSHDFIRDYLVEKIGMRHFVVGYNHRFGRDREGNFDKLKEYAGQYGFGIEQIPAFESDAGEVSSSRIRKCLQEGNVSTANRILGWEYTFSGKVVGGSRLGTSMGFPTANITPDNEYGLIPADGVYAVLAGLQEKTYRGMLNIGSRPTVNKDPEKKTIEVHLLDFKGNIYAEGIRVKFVARLRDEKKFRDTDALKNQLLADRESTLEILSHYRKENSP